jgi:hypothetical protein
MELFYLVLPYYGVHYHHFVHISRESRLFIKALRILDRVLRLASTPVLIRSSARIAWISIIMHHTHDHQSQYCCTPEHTTDLSSKRLYARHLA